MNLRPYKCNIFHKMSLEERMTLSGGLARKLSSVHQVNMFGHINHHINVDLKS